MASSCVKLTQTQTRPNEVTFPPRKLLCSLVNLFKPKRSKVSEQEALGFYLLRYKKAIRTKNLLIASGNILTKAEA